MDKFLNPGVLAWVIPLILAVVIYLVERRSWKLRNGLSVFASAVSFLLVISQYSKVRGGETLLVEFPNILPPLGLSFKLDSLAFLVGAIITGVWFLVTVYSTEYMVKEHAKNRFYPFLVLTLAGALGVVVSGDLFTLFLFFEIMSLSAYVLVVHEETPEALRAGYKYLILTIIGGLALFFAIIAVYEIAGTVSFANGGIIAESSGLALLAFIGFLIGFGIKIGIVPLHVWLPEAHPVAPSPASALLSGLMLKTGAYGLIRVVFNVFGLELVRSTGWNNIILVLGVVTVFLGSAVAITQNDIKRRLAYSSIGQMGYIVVGIGLLQERALVGAIFHIFAHALMKSTLFLAAGAVIYQTGKRSVGDWQGLGRQMFTTMVVFTVAAMSMVGLPPLVGFISKWGISLGALDYGQWGWAYVVLLLMSSLMNFIYYFPLVQSAFFGDHHDDTKVPSPAPGKVPGWAMMTPMIIMAAVIVIVGLLPHNYALELAEQAAGALFVVLK